MIGFFQLRIPSHDLFQPSLESHPFYSGLKRLQHILHQITANPFRSLHVQRPENLGSDDEAGLHTRRRVGLPERFVGCLQGFCEHVSVSDDAWFHFTETSRLDHGFSKMSRVTWITSWPSNAKIGVTLFGPVKSISYLELASYGGFAAHTVLVLHDYRSSHSCPEFIPTHLQAIIFPMVSNNRCNGNFCGLTLRPDNTRVSSWTGTQASTQPENSKQIACSCHGHLDGTA